MKLRHSEKDYPDDNFVPPELRQQDYTPAIEAPEMIPTGELAGVDEEPVAAPPPRGPTREEQLRKILDAQTAHDEARSRRIANAAKLDRKRQNEDDLGALLYAATTRRAPQLRNIANSYTQEAMAEGNDGPL